MYSIEVTTSVLVRTGVSRIVALILNPGGAACSISLDDSISGSGDVKAKLVGTAAGQSVPAFFGEKGIDCGTGVYATISGAGAKAIVVIE
jgi:hypothetical protein